VRFVSPQTPSSWRVRSKPWNGSRLSHFGPAWVETPRISTTCDACVTQKRLPGAYRWNGIEALELLGPLGRMSHENDDGALPAPISKDAAGAASKFKSLILLSRMGCEKLLEVAANWFSAQIERPKVVKLVL